MFAGLSYNITCTAEADRLPCNKMRSARYGTRARKVTDVGSVRLIIFTWNRCTAKMRDVRSVWVSKMPNEENGTAFVAHRAAMQALSIMLDGILDAIPLASKVIYLDIPVYLNVGDLLINKGTEKFFVRSGIDVLARLSIFDICDFDLATLKCSLKASAVRTIRRLDPAAILVFQGGGNFGDLYPDLQLMREAVIEEFTDRKIVILPQSIHFDSHERQERSISKSFTHPDIHFFLRDQPSFDITEREAAGRSTLMPDMAHALWGDFHERSARPPNESTLYFMRRDGEKRSDEMAVESGIDWDDMITSAEKVGWRLTRKSLHMGVGTLQPVVIAAWYRLRDRLIAKSADRFCDHNGVDTDRLHGLILSALVSRPVIYRDNSYGKLGRYAHQWLRPSPLATPFAADRVGAA